MAAHLLVELQSSGPAQVGPARRTARLSASRPDSTTLLLLTPHKHTLSRGWSLGMAGGLRSSERVLSAVQLWKLLALSDSGLESSARFAII